MSMHAPRETTQSFRHAHGEGSIVFDPGAWPQMPTPEAFDPDAWGDAAHAVGSGGRGAAWFIDAGWAPMVLRHYLRGGWMARFSRDAFIWRGEPAVRSFAEFRLLQALRQRALPVPEPLAAAYWRQGRHYRAAILLRRIAGVHSFGQQVMDDAASAPWDACGALIARFHHAGLDHADLNAHNLLFDAEGQGWMIDFDKCRLRDDGSTHWRAQNLSRLRRSLDKRAGPRDAAAIEAGFARLRNAYDAALASMDTGTKA